MIYYTTDGSVPDETSTLFTDAFSIFEDTTVKALATFGGMSDSEVVTAVYTLDPFVPGRIVIYFKTQVSYSTDGTWVGGQWVSWSSSEFQHYAYPLGSNILVSTFENGGYDPFTRNGRLFYEVNDVYNLVDPFTNEFTEYDLEYADAVIGDKTYYVVPRVSEQTWVSYYPYVVYRTTGGQLEMQNFITGTKETLIGYDEPGNDYSFILYAWDGKLYSYHGDESTFYVQERDPATGSITETVTQLSHPGIFDYRSDIVLEQDNFYFPIVMESGVDILQGTFGSDSTHRVFSYETEDASDFERLDADIDVVMLEFSGSSRKWIVVYDLATEQTTEIDISDFTMIHPVEVMRLTE